MGMEMGMADIRCASRSEGGAGAVKLAESVVEACTSESRSQFRFLYPLDKSIKEKIEVCLRFWFFMVIEICW